MFVSDTTFEGCVIFNKSENREMNRCQNENGIYHMTGPIRHTRALIEKVETFEAYWHFSWGHIGLGRLPRSFDQVKGLPKLDRNVLKDIQ